MNGKQREFHNKYLLPPAYSQNNNNSLFMRENIFI